MSEYVNSDSPKYKKMVEWIAKDLEVNSLKYQTVEDMVEAIGLPKERLCLSCWTGEYPVTRENKKTCVGCGINNIG